MNPASVLNKYTVPIRISYKDLIFTSEDKKTADIEAVWHKFILFNITEQEKTAVLDLLIENCSPYFMIPVEFKMETENKASFLTLCGSDVVSKLVDRKLQIKLYTGKIVNYDIVLSYLSFKDMDLNPLKVISNALKNKFSKDLSRKCLSLENFNKDRLLKSLYCPLSVPIVLESILRLCRSLSFPNNPEAKLPIRELILKSNSIQSLIIREKCFNYHLCKLDLRDNKLYNMNSLKVFKEYKITELWLDKNPLCEKYKSNKDYIYDVKSIFPSLQILDGVLLGKDQKKMPLHHKYFVSNNSKMNLIQQFVQHFFTLYDQQDRILMNGLYDAGALFSMTIGLLLNPYHKQLLKKFAVNRNLIKCIDYAKSTELLLHGPENIIKALRHQPVTIHKLDYMDIDVLYSTNNCFAVSVQGPFMFKECSIQPLWFNRTLIVVSKEDNEYCIINDQYHIDQVSFNINVNIIEELKNKMQKSFPIFNPITFSTEEKKQLLKLLQELTSLNQNSSLEYLQNANWDIRNAINTFKSDYNDEKISKDDFRQ